MTWKNTPGKLVYPSPNANVICLKSDAQSYWAAVPCGPRAPSCDRGQVWARGRGAAREVTAAGPRRSSFSPEGLVSPRASREPCLQGRCCPGPHWTYRNSDHQSQVSLPWAFITTCASLGDAASAHGAEESAKLLHPEAGSPRGHSRQDMSPETHTSVPGL